MANKTLSRRISIQSFNGQPVDMPQLEGDVQAAIRKAAKGNSAVTGRASVEQTAPGAIEVAILIHIVAPIAVATYKTVLSILKEKYFVQEPKKGDSHGDDDKQ